MEVRIESMICVWFAEKHELDKFFLYGFGSHVANTISTCINATRATPKW